uniref:NAD(P)-binding protein n=1 Tax=Mycena chlorophos TaxID=658473 RepID=A0ABQ0LKZ1_MYCCL|nr:predicted protein [Mycena chlorophos]
MSSSEQQIVLVVGASRGLGLVLVEQLAKSPTTRALGTVRTQSPALQAQLPSATFLTADITNEASVLSAAQNVPELDVLIVNAGMGARDPVTQSSTETLAAYLDTNVLGPHRAIRAFLPALRARKTRKIILISSSSGCLTHQAMPDSIGLAGCYGTSKAALNMLAVQTSNELNRAGEEFTVVSIHPGWVATDMGNRVGHGGMPPAESASKILELVGRLETGDSASFYKSDGEKMPW